MAQGCHSAWWHTAAIMQHPQLGFGHGYEWMHKVLLTCKPSVHHGPRRAKGGPIPSLLSLKGPIHLQGKGSSSHLFKRPAVICSHSELLHLWMLSLLQVKPLYPMSVSTASRGNAITSTFFWLKPISSFSGATRQSQCPILFRTRPSAWPWKCWCHHTWNTTTSHLSHDRAESFKRLIKIITTLF